MRWTAILTFFCCAKKAFRQSAKKIIRLTVFGQTHCRRCPQLTLHVQLYIGIIHLKSLLCILLFLYHVVFVVYSSGSYLVVFCFAWDNRGKVFISQSWCGISHLVFPMYDILSTFLANSLPASSAPAQSSFVLWVLK